MSSIILTDDTKAFICGAHNLFLIKQHASRFDKRL